MPMSSAAKRADKKYNKETIKAQANYKKNDLNEGKRLLLYLKETNQTMNSYIKALIKADLDNRNIPYPQSKSINNND